ncbi:MAG: extracellular solute-binding protein [Chloroflexota bacterium]
MVDRMRAATAVLAMSAIAVPLGVASPVAAQSAAPSDISCTITVLTNRTDIADSVFAAQYVPEFQKTYPGVQVKFEALKNYDTDVQTRMNTTDYGDVLLIPNSVPVDQLPNFFEPLGSLDDLSQQYNWVTERAYDGQVYGIAQTGNASGVVYNKKVWDAAGIKDLPTTPDEFLADLKAIKDANAGNADFVAPYYTNYKDGWPLVQWIGDAGSVTNDPDFMVKLIRDAAPFSEGKDLYVLSKLQSDIVSQGLSEEDPATTDWETSKGLLGTGKISAMVLGSWSVTQMQQAAEAAGASADDIHYMPFPAWVDGSPVSVSGGDYKLAINKNSGCKDGARAWLDWFLKDSGYAYAEGGLSPVKGGKNSPIYADLEAAGTKFIELNPATGADVGLLDQIQNESEVNLYDPSWRQRIVDAARGATSETLDAIFADLNTKWADAQSSLGIQ